MNICIRKAVEGDARPLTAVSRQAFNHDIHYGAPQVGGPPGYDMVNWQLRMILTCDYYKIEDEDGRLLGGIIVYPKGYRHMELGRIFVQPDCQNQGIGAQAIRFLEETYPETDRWTLDTPAWNTRNRYFYEKMGYRLTGEEGHGGVWYAKQIGDKE
ncbi:MAG: GNAT family N-acetyltransferase [Candidatus Promineifilaceae bacterium]